MWGSLVSWFTGGGNTAEKVLDTVSAGVDMAWFTEEEKSIAAAKVLDFKLKWMQATSGQNLARRVIAFGVVGLWIVLIVIACVLRIWSVEGSDFLFTVLKDIVSLPFTVIIGFYFAAHVLSRVKEA